MRPLKGDIYDVLYIITRCDNLIIIRSRRVSFLPLIARSETNNKSQHYSTRILLEQPCEPCDEYDDHSVASRVFEDRALRESVAPESATASSSTRTLHRCQDNWTAPFIDRSQTHLLTSRERPICREVCIRINIIYR
jgi:hypothetical protein